MKATILLLPGDGVGPEVTRQARRVLERLGELAGHEFAFEDALIGGCAIDEAGAALPDETLARCRDTEALLLGAVGGPRWSDPTASERPELGLLRLRQELDLFANLRPVPVFESLRELVPLRADLIPEHDLLFVRELTGGIYFGERHEQGDGTRAWDTLDYSVAEVERVAHVAFRAARQRRGKVASIDKANVLASMRLWRRTIEQVACDYPDVEMEHVLVDAAAMHLIRDPSRFDVIVAGNMFGDILSDEASVLAGSLGMLPSASLSDGTQGLYEPVHGSAPDIAGQGICNPIGALLSAAMMLRHTLALEAEAAAIETAVRAALETGARTADLGSAKVTTEALSTEQMTDVILRALESQLGT